MGKTELCVISDLLGVMLGGYCPRLFLFLLLFDFLMCVLFMVWLLSCGHCHVWFLLVVCDVCVFVDCCFVVVSVVVSVVTCVSEGYAFVVLVVVVLALLGSRT